MLSHALPHRHILTHAESQLHTQLYTLMHSIPTDSHTAWNLFQWPDWLNGHPYRVLT